MDIISFNEASTANGRIESFIENPDSTSGIVTVPKVIASGETITIPAGRVAILPNMQIDGVLNVEGEVFIPSGSTVSQVIPRVTSIDNAIVRFDGTTGAVQNSGVIIDDNGNVGIGTSNPIDKLTMYSASGNLFLRSQSGTSTLLTGVYSDGTTCVNSLGNYPLILLTNNVERMRIDAAGNVLLSGYGYTSRLSGNGNGYTNSFYDSSTTYDNNCISANFVRTGTNSGTINSSYLGTAEVQLLTGWSNKGTVNINTGISNTIPTTKLTIDASGNVLVVSPTGGLGYGAGSGGTVTQLTSKSTAVTLNKPTGTITMHNDTLAAGASVVFQINNSLVSTLGDTVLVNGLWSQVDPINYRIESTRISGGSFTIRVTNISGSSLSEPLIIHFNVHKGAVS